MFASLFDLSVDNGSPVHSSEYDSLFGTMFDQADSTYTTVQEHIVDIENDLEFQFDDDLFVNNLTKLTSTEVKTP